MKPLRVYVDTSVFGGCFDREFAVESLRFFDLVRAGKVAVLVSRVVAEELASAPPRVLKVLESLAAAQIETIPVPPEAIELRDAYLAAGIVGPRSVDDATHVAAATVARAAAIVSWNFKHLVRLDKVRAYNQVNMKLGFGLMSIVSPMEVRFDDTE